MSVSRIAAWAQEDDYGVNGLSYTPPAGSRRCAVFVVGGEENGATQSGPMSVASATLGGQACVVQAPANLQAGTDGGYHNTGTIVTLNEAGIDAMSGNAFVITWAGFDSGNGPFPTSPIVHYATLQDVDQANINSANQSNTSDANVLTLSPTSTMNVAVDELVIAVNIGGQPSTPSSSAGGLSEQTEYVGAANDMSMAVYERTALTADASYTFTMDLATTATRMVVLAIAFGFDAGAAAPLYEQDSFRGRNDDGSESAATWIATANTNWTQNPDENFRIRFLIEETADEVDDDVTFQLQYNKNGGGWNDVNAASSNVRSSASPNVVDGADTTEQMGGPGTFITNNDGFDEVNGLAGGTVLDFTATANQEVEVEFCVQIRTVDTAPADTIQLRVVRGPSTVLNAYTNTPTITLPSLAYDQDGFQFINDDGSESGATDLAAEDTNITAGKESNVRLRVQIDSVGDDPPSVTRTLQYKEVGDPSGEWRDVPLT